MTTAASTQTGATGLDALAAYPQGWRVAAALLKVASRGGLLVVLYLLLFSESPPTNPFRQMRLFFGFFAAPEAAAWCIARAFATKVELTGDALVLEQRGQRMEIPTSAIAALEPWRVPLPGPGAWLRLRSGRRFSHGLAMEPSMLLGAIGGVGATADWSSHPMVAFSAARRAVATAWLENPFLKFGIWSLIPAVVAFRLHQWITFGGTFGEYYTFGLVAYLKGFALWWVSYAYSLLVLAAGLRAIVEIVAIAATFAAPSRAVPIRRALEIAQRILFYVGVPAWLAIRFSV
jgi:apolipoprotein N-acyltransferase